MEGTLVKSDDKAFHYLLCQELQVIKLSEFKLIEIFHRVENKDFLSGGSGDRN